MNFIFIHGYQQTKAKFRVQTGGFRKKFKKKINFYFCEAPFLAPLPSTAQNLINMGMKPEDLKKYYKTWWDTKIIEDKETKKSEYKYIGVEDSIKLIYEIEEISKVNKIDGIIGFSQGALMGMIFSSVNLIFNKIMKKIENENNKDKIENILEDEEKQFLKRWKFDLNDEKKLKEKYEKFKHLNNLIVFGGFPPRDQEIEDLLTSKKWFPNKIPINSFHISGENDSIIPTAYSFECINYFQKSGTFKNEKITHEDGHIVQWKSNVTDSIKKFLKID